MMSLTVCACLVLSLVTLHSVSGTVWCRYVTRSVVVSDRWPMTLASAAIAP
jgi:hypothetical protein